MESISNSFSNELTESTSTPLVSILCITYNHENFISRTIESFLSQKTNFPFEIIVGEDCSTDGTLSVINRYRIKYPDLIRVITSESNVGPLNNIRRTLKICKGKYIALCEGDDYWTDIYKIQIQVAFLENNPDYVVTYHDACAFDDISISRQPQLTEKYQCDASQLDLIHARPISSLTACFRNVLIDIPSEFNQAPIIDLCLWSLLGNFGKGKYLSNIKPGAYRVHAGGIFSTQTSENKNRMTMHTFLCLSQYYARIGNAKISSHFIFRTITLGCSQITSIQKLKLIGTQLDSLFGSPIYLFLKIFTRR